MVIYQRLTKNGSEVVDYYNLRVSKAISDNENVSNFSCDVENFAGRNKDFQVGDLIDIYAGSTINPTTKIFTGILEDIKYRGNKLDEKITIMGRDYVARLCDRSVEPEVYNNLYAGSIIKDLIAKYTDNLTTNNVYSGTEVSRIRFNHIPVYDAIKQLAQNSDYYFYVDTNKDLHFEPKSIVNSNLTIYSGNCVGANFKEQRDTLYNQIWVYGDRYLDGFKEVLNGSVAVGSVMTLLYKPHNLSILNGNTSVQPGAIYEMSLDAGSNVKYLVSYEDKQIIFTSGTSQGNNIPKAGSIMTFTYDRLLPIVKVGDNEPSKQQYGTRVKVIVDKNIKDPNTAVDIMQSNLALYGEPSIQGDIYLKGLYDLTPGNTCIVDMPYQNVNNETYDLLSVDYDFNIINCQKEEVIKVKLNKKISDVTDTIKDIILRLKKLEASDIDDTDILTRFQSSTGSQTIVQSGCLVYTRLVGGLGLIYDSPTYGIYGTALYGGSGLNCFILGHTQFGILGTSKLGAPQTNWTLVWSGCYM